MRNGLAWCAIGCIQLIGAPFFPSASGETANSKDVAESDPAVSRIVGITAGLPVNGVVYEQISEPDWGNKVGFKTNPLNVVSRGFTGGPLMGNGDIGVTQGGDSDSQVLYISKNGMFKPLGGITITSLTKGAEIASYRYEQDIFHAEVRARVTMNGAPVDLLTWTSANENMIVTELTNRSSSPLDLRMELWVSATPPPVNGKGKADSSSISKAGIDQNILWGTRELLPTKVAMASTLLDSKIVAATGTETKSCSTFSILPGKTVTLVTVVDGATGFPASLPKLSSYLDNAIAQARQINNARIKSLQDSHRQWWRDFWSKSEVELNDPKLEKFYYGSLYALACCNRTGKIAPGLWGNWITSEFPFWDGAYFSNYNFQAPYWGIYAGNHPELGAAFNEQVFGHQPWARNRAHNAGYPGLDSMRVPPIASLNLIGYAKGVPKPAPVAPTKNRKYLNDQFCVILLNITNLVNHYYYTMDRKYLETRLYPYLLELGAFWDAYLVKVDGRYVINASGAREEDKGCSTNSIIDLGLVRFLYKSLLATSRDLNVDKDKRAGWQEKLDKLSDYPTTTYNGKTVFKEYLERKGMTLHGVHDNPVNLSHIFPAEGIGLESPEPRKTIARDTIELMDSWKQSNAFPFIFPIAIRVGYDPNEVWKQLMSLLNGPGWRETNLTFYQGGGGIEVCGAIEAINSMLLQSHEDAIRVFPVWPADKSAKFKRLRAKGAFLVDAEFTRGAVASVKIYSEKGMPCSIINPWPGSALVIKDGNDTVLAGKHGEKYVFNTIAGHAYVLSK
ncbi:MAG: glycoside hydrolase family 95-like protein [Victivallales bacterium]